MQKAVKPLTTDPTTAKTSKQQAREYWRTIEIIKQLRELPDLDEVPLITWNEMEKRAYGAEKMAFMVGIAFGGLAMLILLVFLRSKFGIDLIKT